MPGTAFVELALAAGEQVGAEQVAELTLQAPLVIPESGSVFLQVTVSAHDEGRKRPISIHSRPQGAADGELADAPEWTLHATGSLSAEAAPQPKPLGEWPPQGAEPIAADGLYERLGQIGFAYGPAFRGLTAAWRDGEALYAEVALPEEQREQAARFAIHPALLDSSLHAVVLSVFESEDPEQGIGLPFSWGEISVGAVGAEALRVRLTLEGEATSIELADQSGAPVAQVGSLRSRPISSEQLEGAKPSGTGLYGLEWKEATLPEPAEATVATLGGLELPGAGRYESLTALIEAIDAGVLVPDAVLCEPEPETSEQSAAASLSVVRTALGLLREWIAETRLADCRLTFLTHEAVPTSAEESPELPGASLWGLLRTAQSEHPGGFALVDTDGSEASGRALLAVLGQDEEPQLALRDGIALVPRLASEPEREPTASLDPDRTVLVTGATGVLGGLVARHLAAAHGARHLLLVSRRGAEADGAAQLQAELAELGAEVRIEACDASDRAQLEALLGSISAEHPLGAIVHAAGTIDDATIESLGEEQLDGVFAPKADAAWHLHELTKDLQLSSFVMFSSVAGLLGGPGQANYAAANSFLDALAQLRQGEGLAATSIAWGLWATASGIASELSESDLKRIERSGIGVLSEEQGLAFLDQALSAEEPLVIALDVIPRGLRSLAQVGMLPPLFRGLVRVPRRRSGAASAALTARFDSLSGPEREQAMLEVVSAEVAAVLGHDSAAAIDPGKAFKDLGFDSLAAVELRNRLAGATGMSLQPTVVFDYPSSSSLAEHLLERLAPAKSPQQAVVAARAADEPIAIVGMSCRYPGGITSPEGLWRLVANGADGVDGFPADRGWDLDGLYDPDPDAPGTSYTREGGFLYDSPQFDAEFFGIGPREALATDPQQRLLLEAAWEALESLGVDPSTLRGSQTGVFAGMMYHDYGRGAVAPEELEGYMAVGMGGSILSGRVAYTLGLEGPAVTLDTACSSSLVTLHLAAQALRQGECSLALAGGVTVMATPIVFTEFSRQRGLAPDGRSKSFAEAADGVGWSEGVGMLALQRLSDARREGRRVHAVLKGSAVNQDGASNGLTAPNGPSQERVIRQALANAGLEPGDVDAVEAHGTGTTLGDPIEAGALLATYGQDREEPLRLGSIKSNLGHTQAASGAAGVIKIVMALREGVLPKTLHVDAPSSNVDWEAGEIELLTEPVPWQPNGRPRRAAVSSFGISGTNAHVILEEAPAVEVEEGREEAQPLPIPTPLAISAKTEPALREAAADLAAHLEDNPELDPTDVAFSLTTTRAVFNERAVALGENREQLIERLQALARGENPPGSVTNKAQTGKLAYLLTGQGSQRATMGKGLYDTDPTYAKALDQACEALDPHLERPLQELLFAKQGSPEAELLEDTTFTQPALFATELALYESLKAKGLAPDLLAGHSIGEIAAAQISGVLSLQDAAKLVAARARLMGALPSGGAMVAIEATELEVKEAIEGKEGELSIAAVNA
ncbi:MAG: SDR family NAD(P)-dependent oxidoreductase, partial [Solirubrobacterales bacterium]